MTNKIISRIALLTLSLFSFIFVSEAKAQSLQIHGHPQKTSYSSPAEWPVISVQTHWAPGENPVLPPASIIVLDLVNGKFGNSTISHVHLDLDAPIYAEVAEAVVFNFTIKQFHMSGRTYLDPSRLESYRDIVWDETGTSSPPDMIGDPHAVKEYKGKITMDPVMSAGHQPPLKGWFAPDISVFTQFDNGDSVTTKNYIPLYSMVDPTAAETHGNSMLSGRSTAASSRRPEKSWGVTLVESTQYIPLAPIHETWTNVYSSAGYGGINPEPATLDMRADLDLHSGNAGRLLFTSSKPGDVNELIPFNPTILGSGDHKVAIIRSQPDALEMLATLVVYTVTVENSIPLPTSELVPNVVGQLQTAAIALLVMQNFTSTIVSQSNEQVLLNTVISQEPAAGTLVPRGSDVRLIISSGPAPTVWETITPFFQKFVVPGQPTKYRLCESLNICKEIQ